MGALPPGAFSPKFSDANTFLRCNNNNCTDLLDRHAEFGMFGTLRTAGG